MTETEKIIFFAAVFFLYFFIAGGFIGPKKFRKRMNALADLWWKNEDATRPITFVDALYFLFPVIVICCTLWFIFTH